jgi:hypothetical protein
MKNIRYIFKMLPLLGLLLTACEKFLDVNTDETLKGDAVIQELLPTAQFYTAEASFQQAYVACQYAQQLGSALGANGIDTYAETDNTLGWSNLYLYALPQLNAIIKKARTRARPLMWVLPKF